MLQSCALRRKFFAQLLRVRFDSIKLGDKFLPIGLRAVPLGGHRLELLAKFRDIATAGLRLRFRGGQLFDAFREGLPGLFEILQQRRLFPFKGVGRFRDFLQAAFLFGSASCLHGGGIFQFLRRSIAGACQFLDLSLRDSGRGVALGEQRFDAVAVFRDVVLETGDGPRFPLRPGRRSLSGSGKCHGLAAHFFDFLRPFVAFRERLSIRLGEGLDAFLQFLLRAGGFGFAFARRGIGFALRFRAHRLDQRRCLLPGALRRGEGPLGLDPDFALAVQFLRSRALAAFKRGDAALQFLQLPLVFLFRKTDLHDCFLLRGESGGGIRELVGQL